MTDVIDYLNSKNISYEMSGNDAIITCPNCGKKKLYINVETGVHHCFHCDARDPNSITAKGHINQLKEVWGDVLPIATLSSRIDPKSDEVSEVDYSIDVSRYHTALKDNKKALRYLNKRGVSQESIDNFKLGFSRQYDQNWLVIPSFEEGVPKLIKMRKLPPDENTKLAKYIRRKGSKSVLFNGDIIDQYDEIFICEGELDAITLIQNGYPNTIGITGGAGTLLSEWYDKLLLKDKFYLIFDNDEAGQKASRDVWATRLGLARCWNVLLPPEMDVNDFFNTYDRENFDGVLEQARKFQIKGIISLGDAFRKMYERSLKERDREQFPLPWQSVNKLLGGGFERKRLVVAGGIPGVGKTSLAIEICWHFAKIYNMPSLFFCMEMPEISLATKIVQLEKDVTLHEVDFANALVYAMELKGLPMYFGYSSKVTPSVFYNTMEAVRNRFGIEFGVFDNLQRMVRSGDESDMGQASGLFKDITMDLDIPFLLISQPRKLNEKGTPTFDDLKGSSAIPADADTVILLHRNRLKGKKDTHSSLNPVTQILIDKSRFSSGGKTQLYFDGAKSKFKEMEEQYGSIR